MAVSNEQYLRILARLTKIEETINDALVAATHYVTMSQVQQLLTIISTDLDDVTATVATLEDRVESIEEEPLK